MIDGGCYELSSCGHREWTLVYGQPRGYLIDRWTERGMPNWELLDGSVGCLQPTQFRSTLLSFIDLDGDGDVLFIDLVFSFSIGFMCGCDVLDTQVAVIAGNLELAEIIQNYKPEDIGESFFDGDGEIVELIERQFNIGQKEETTLFPCPSSLLLWLYYNCFLINHSSMI